jgi:RNA polymerase sigma-70 factor (ECF subfamily)
MIEVITEYRDYLINYLKRSIDQEAAEDVAQEAILRAIKHADSFKGACTLQTWLTQIAKNAMLDWKRSAKAHETLSLDEPILTGDNSLAYAYEALPDPIAIDPCDEVCRKDASERLGRLIEEVYDSNRDALVLYHFKDYSYPEIADILNIPVNTVKTKISRARKQLKWMIEYNEEDLCEV